VHWRSARPRNSPDLNALCIFSCSFIAQHFALSLTFSINYLTLLNPSSNPFPSVWLSKSYLAPLRAILDPPLPVLTSLWSLMCVYWLTGWLASSPLNNQSLNDALNNTSQIDSRTQSMDGFKEVISTARMVSTEFDVLNDKYRHCYKMDYVQCSPDQMWEPVNMIWKHGAYRDIPLCYSPVHN
jgi:hypothetical protein